MTFKGSKFRLGDDNDSIEAFEKLFKKHYADLVNFANGILKDPDASEEIVQDFFYNLWKNRDQIDIRFSVKAYLYRSVRNNALKYLDALEVRRKYARRLLDEEKDKFDYQNRDLELSELQRIVDDTLEELPERCATIFRMNRFEGYKYEEIANELSVSVKTVEANMSKALRLFREKFGKYYKQGKG